MIELLKVTVVNIFWQLSVLPQVFLVAHKKSDRLHHSANCILKRKDPLAFIMASTNKSSSSKKNKHEISYKQFLSCLSNLDDNIDFSKFTTDAVEALRLCHMEFVSLLASELAHQREDNALDHRDKSSMSSKPIQEIHVEKCMKDLHYDSLLERTLHEVELR